MPAKPILRVGKMKETGRSTPQAVMNHLARSRPTPNADPDRTIKNRWLVGDPDMNLYSAVHDLIGRAGITRIRKDATIANDVLLSVSPEWFRPDNPEARGTYSEDRVKAFQAEAEQMLRETFGPRLVAAVLHLDEATPHVQAVVVPIMPGKNDPKQRRLSGKDMFNKTSLGQLQQRWEERMGKHGVGPRQKGSKARHTTLREYYGALEAARSEDPRARLEFSDPPVRGRLEGGESYRKRTETWKKDQRKALKKQLRPMAKQAAQGRLWDAERRSGIETRSRLADLGEELTRTYEELDLAKEQVSALRSTPINEVAIALGYTGTVQKGENAIDLVKRVGQLDYRQSVTWLAQRFDPEIAATAARENAARRIERDAEGPRVLSKSERTKDRAVAQQLDALAAPAYRVTIMRERQDKRSAYNIGKGQGPDGAERFYSAAEVREMIPRLTAENARDGNIYITPKDSAARHVLVDDLTPATLDELRGRGYAPAVIQESSPGSIQAIIKVPRDLPEADLNEWFKDLNRDLGDEKIVGLDHPFRLAGFQNRKPKHEGADAGRRPFVRLIEASNRMCQRAIEVVRAYGRNRTQRDAERPSGPPEEGGLAPRQ